MASKLKEPSRAASLRIPTRVVVMVIPRPCTLLMDTRRSAPARVSRRETYGSPYRRRIDAKIQLQNSIATGVRLGLRIGASAAS
jgi:hypothetical protein